MDEEGVMDGNTGKIQEEDRKTNNEDGGKTNGRERSLAMQMATEQFVSCTNTILQIKIIFLKQSSDGF